MTNTELKSQIDSQITNKTTLKSIAPGNVGDNIKAVVDYVDQQVPSNIWIARINNTGVDSVIHDGIGFTSPVITNPTNGVIKITKTGFFTGKTPSKIEIETPNLDNAGSLYLASGKQDSLFPNDTITITLFPKDGSIVSTPSFSNYLVKIKIYN